ncbi:Fc receptor-like protein 5 isoform X6 [Loxodonta africana]|uniref:Fc receptor-like protein 5 isoform X6 n=1 Tax=Loxodonta africana TaxID=9785 RepID=UPI0030CAE785
MTFETQVFQDLHPGNLCLLQPLTALLLLASADTRAEDLPKAVLNLEPPWINVLQDDYVTLKCHGAHTPAKSATQWFHRGSPIPAQVQPNYGFKATINDSGEYRCQTGQTSLSDPVQLDVVPDWLLLQTRQLVFQEGEPIMLRCHSWKNRPQSDITFFQNGKSMIFFNKNTTFSIPRANHSHSGDYHCTAMIGDKLKTSRPVTITVQEDLPKAVLNLEPPWINVLQDDYVTLKCHGAHTPAKSATQWFHRGSPIPAQVQPNYGFKATINDSGEYRCQTGQTSLSDPVQLDVVPDWLLLQTRQLVFQEGEPIMLRCHSWKNRPQSDITFFQNGKSMIFFNKNTTFSIPRANHSHSGDYHCTAMIGDKLKTSRPVTITVQEDLPKAVVNLEPPWINVLQDDYVTLKCHGAHTPAKSATQWFHRGSPIPAQVQPNYGFKATINDSGEYRCQTGQTSLSDPVQLDVVPDWLLLQTRQLVFQEGEPIMLRCHSWKNRPQSDIMFFQNGKSKIFFNKNTTFSIPRANHSHSGDYHCTAMIGDKLKTSRPVTITVQGLPVLPGMWLQP